MTSHEEIQEQIPAYAASRLAPAEARRLEEHLASCEACRELLATTKGIAGAIREGGASMFEPHPAELALRDHAGGKAGPEERARIAKHIESCATCRLEIEAWETVLAAPDRFARSAEAQGATLPRAGFSRWLTPTLTAAAGLILGALLVTLNQKAPEPAAVPAPAPAPTQSAGPPGNWAGASPLFILPGMMRGGDGMPSSQWVIGKDDTHLSVAVQPVLPPEMPNDAPCRLELFRNDGTAAWSMEMAAGKMREHLGTQAGVVHLTLPVEGLASGAYEFRITIAGDPAAPPIYRARIEIATAP